MRTKMLFVLIGLAILFHTQTAGAHLTGEIAHTFRTSITLYVFDDPDLRPLGIPEGWLYQAARAAASAWNLTGMGLTLTVVSSNAIAMCGDGFFDIGWMYRDPLQWGGGYTIISNDALAVTFGCAWWGKIFGGTGSSEQDIYFPITKWGWFGLYSDWFDLYRLMLHEMGHILGLKDAYWHHKGPCDEGAWTVMLAYQPRCSAWAPTWADQQWALLAYPPRRTRSFSASDSYYSIEIYDLSGRLISQQLCSYGRQELRTQRALAGIRAPIGAYIAVMRDCETGMVTVKKIAKMP